MVCIGKIKLKNGLVLAPMAGFSDVGLRALACEFGADYAVTEMVSAKALTMNSKKTLQLLATDKAEKIKAVQLFGSDPQVFAAAVQHPAIAKFDIIDINMGCPVKKIVRNGEGSALMCNVKLAEQIIKSCVANTSKPVTVKFRKGINLETAVEFAKMCECSGASAICVHGRTAAQGYSGVADYDTIKRVKAAVKIPVFASGDIKSLNDAKKVQKYTGADGSFIGRAALGNPQIFLHCPKHSIKRATKDIILKHVEILEKHKAFNISAFKAHIVHYTKGIVGIKSRYNEIFAAKTKAELTDLIENIFAA